MSGFIPAEYFGRIVYRIGSAFDRGISGSDRRRIVGRKNSLYTAFF
jgi:hypothetical protein